ncbi:flagellar hook-associated protein FlgL [Candidatus Dactylopiibacterium carminicum]|uniref:flagellar hook-associated protein FlgL n=1 Tax=Candidatus Dactylopiibacterium carminicum TaxID=857335 RepID=UPI001CC2F38B|nr:flagellar hook-associated protein FlgL [Candidatus Dactylopiibacterium carminicum]
MRIASTQYHSTMNTALQSASARLESIIAKMASGQKLSVPSDDPVTHVRLSRLNREEAALAQYRDNIGALQVRLTQNETTLDSMSSDLQDARDLMVWALDGSNSAEDLSAMSSSLEALLSSLYYSANSKDQEGRYLFSGTLTDTASVSYDESAPLGSRYSFDGNTTKQDVVVGNGVTQAANVTVEELPAVLNLLENTISLLQTDDVNVNDTAVRDQLTSMLNGIDAAMDSLSGKIASLGGIQNVLETMDNNHANVSVAN